MAKLIRIDRKLRRVGRKLVTDAGGAPCCCGCTLWRKCVQCSGSGVLWICDGTKCGSGIDAAPGTVFRYAGLCYTVTSVTDPDPTGTRVPHGAQLACIANCAACYGDCPCWKGYTFVNDGSDCGTAYLSSSIACAGQFVTCGCPGDCCDTFDFLDYVGTLNFNGVPNCDCDSAALSAERSVTKAQTACSGGSAGDRQFISQNYTDWRLHFTGDFVVGQTGNGWSTGTPDIDGMVRFRDEPVVEITCQKDFGNVEGFVADNGSNVRRVQVSLFYGLASDKWYMEAAVVFADWSCVQFLNFSGMMSASISRLGPASFLASFTSGLAFTGHCAKAGGGCSGVPVAETYSLSGTIGAAWGGIQEC